MGQEEGKKPVDAALIVEGGGFRGIFAAGVLDVLMEQGIKTEYVCGVSAGALTAYDYVASLPGRTCGYYKSLCQNKDFLSVKNFIRTGSFFSFETMYQMSEDEYRETELSNLASTLQKFEVAATDLFSGEADYFALDANDLTAFHYACKASSSLPGLNEPVKLNGSLYYDGGCAAPVPYYRAKQLGYEKIIVITTRPLDDRARPYPRVLLSYFKRKFRSYPEFYKCLAKLSQKRNEEYEELVRHGEAGDFFVISPSPGQAVGMLVRDPAKLDALYQEGRRIMTDGLSDLAGYLENY